MTVTSCQKVDRECISGAEPRANNLSTDTEQINRLIDPTIANEITYRIIGAAMRVHNALGPGLKESAYQKALSVEFEKDGLSFEEEYAVEIHLDRTRVGLLHLDHFVNDLVVVEEKAFPHMITNEEIAQVITYLCATNKPVGILLNFGRGRLEYKRLLPPTDRQRWGERIARYLWIPPEARTNDRSVDPFSIR